MIALAYTGLIVGLVLIISGVMLSTTTRDDKDDNK